MKTNLVKKGSEKNIEMFELTNEELVTINGGGAYQMLIRQEDGTYVWVVVNRNSMSNRFSSYRNN